MCDTNTKVCNTCKVEKLESDFYLKDKKTGRMDTSCKSCIKKRANDYYQENSEKIKDSRRKPIEEWDKFIWTKEMFIEIVPNYDNRSQLKEDYPALLRKAKNEWPELLDELLPVTIINWDMDLLDKEISKCSDYKDFFTNHRSCYTWVKQNDLTDYVKSKLNTINNTDYTPELIMSELSNCGIVKLSDLMKSEYRLYYYAGVRRGMKIEMDVLFEKTGESRTKEQCAEIAAKFKTRKEFKEKEPTVLSYSYNNGWLDEICSHMKRLGSLTERALYMYRFPDGAVYYGLTDDLGERYNSHIDLNNSSPTSVTKYMKKTGMIPVYIQLSDYFNAQLAATVEDGMIKNSKKQGIKVLNRVKGGGLGKLPKVLKEEIIKSTIGYKYWDVWKKEQKRYYDISVSRNGKIDGFLNNIFIESGLIKRDLRTIWTFENIKKYIIDNNITSRTGERGLKDLNQPAYQSARNNNWLDILLPNKYENHSEKVKISKCK